MRTIIIGHGPSILRQKLGSEIDRHDQIIRMKRHSDLPKLRPDLYGSRTDVVVSSMTLGRVIMDAWEGVKDFWLFDDTRTENDSDKTLPQDANVYCDRDVCRFWRTQYRRLRKDYVKADSQKLIDGVSDNKGHLHPSAGTHAILYAMHKANPDEIQLHGFDNILSGTHDWSITRGHEYKEYPDHNWPAESQMLDLLCRVYGYQMKKGDTGSALLNAI